ncbi:MAG: 4Fe-4S dicluster domain-containing protein [Candidatus Hodarchaeota archaeon]
MVVVDYELRKKIMDAHIDDTLKYCYQCARCTDVCPVAKVSDQRYNPRPIILNSFLGLNTFIGQKNNFSIWGCTVCDTCDEECPQKIELTEIFTVLKNMSIAAGEGPDYYTTQASTIYDNGKAIPPQPAVERRREQLDLPKIEPPNVNEVQKILNATKLNKILNK